MVVNDPKGSSASPAQIASDVVIGNGALLTNKLIVGSGVVIEQGVIFSDSGKLPTKISENVLIGAGCVIGPDLEVGRGAHILPGTVIMSSVPANAVVSGNPARIVGYTLGPNDNSVTDALHPVEGSTHRQSRTNLGVGNAALFQMSKVSDLRGSLTVGELGADFPFRPQRYFIVFDVPSEELRGEHAHRECEQFLICVRGSCKALLDDGSHRSEVVLDRPEIGLYVPPMIWGTQYRYTPDAVLLVLASLPYDPSDYIRTYELFRAEVDESRP